MSGLLPGAVLTMWWEEYLTIPFVPFGRDRSGCDCWGLARLIEREVFDRRLPSYLGEYEDYGRKGGVPQAISNNLDQYTLVHPGEERSGDLCLITLSGVYVHIGVVTTPGRFVHAASDTLGVIVEPYTDYRYRNRVELCRV